ncbi:ATP-binding protein [Endozoicomonas lisbonensis]|uniref:ATP-binding protein n=1 Tax=Endozoicomonas lisbonensis TaxID=3120522 RepID=UPI00339B8BFC
MLVQRIKHFGLGKTTFLESVAKGAVASGFKVALICPSSDLVRIWRQSMDLEGVDVLPHDFAILRRMIRQKPYDYILLDDCNSMDQSQGDPVTLVEYLLKHKADKQVIIGTYDSDTDNRKANFVEWQLTELATTNESDIEGGSIEIYGEDPEGREVSSEVSIPDIANQALGLIAELRAS